MFVILEKDLKTFLKDLEYQSGILSKIAKELSLEVEDLYNRAGLKLACKKEGFDIKIVNDEYHIYK